MPKLSVILAATATLTVPIGGEVLTLDYRPNVYTVAWLQQAEQLSIAEALHQLVDRWDLTDDAGEPYPLTVEALTALPVPLLREVWGGIRGDLLPNLPSATT